MSGIILHGICYDFFFVTGQIYTDKQAGEEHKSSAQGLITLATYGVGMLIGSYLAGAIVENYTIEGGTHDWVSIWMLPATFAAVVMLLFAVMFKDHKITNKTEEK